MRSAATVKPAWPTIVPLRPPGTPSPAHQSPGGVGSAHSTIPSISAATREAHGETRKAPHTLDAPTPEVRQRASLLRWRGEQEHGEENQGPQSAHNRRYRQGPP